MTSELSTQQPDEFCFYHYVHSDNKFFFVTCKVIFQNFPNRNEHRYDHEFFFPIDRTTNYHVCISSAFFHRKHTKWSEHRFRKCKAVTFGSKTASRTKRDD